eukprot:tig00000310_g23960.t1
MPPKPPPAQKGGGKPDTKAAGKKSPVPADSGDALVLPPVWSEEAVTAEPFSPDAGYEDPDGLPQLPPELRPRVAEWKRPSEYLPNMDPVMVYFHKPPPPPPTPVPAEGEEPSPAPPEPAAPPPPPPIPVPPLVGAGSRPPSFRSGGRMPSFRAAAHPASTPRGTPILPAVVEAAPPAPPPPPPEPEVPLTPLEEAAKGINGLLLPEMGAAMPWLASQIGALVAREGPLAALAPIYPKGEDGLPRYNPGGKYIVKLHYFGEWRAVAVDDKMPVGPDGSPVLPQSVVRHELWPLVLSKALLKLARGAPEGTMRGPAAYGALTGRPPEALEAARFDLLPSLTAALQERGAHVLATPAPQLAPGLSPELARLEARPGYAVLVAGVRSELGASHVLLASRAQTSESILIPWAVRPDPPEGADPKDKKGKKGDKKDKDKGAGEKEKEKEKGPSKSKRMSLAPVPDDAIPEGGELQPPGTPEPGPPPPPPVIVMPEQEREEWVPLEAFAAAFPEVTLYYDPEAFAPLEEPTPAATATATPAATAPATPTADRPPQPPDDAASVAAASEAAPAAPAPAATIHRGSVVRAGPVEADAQHPSNRFLLDVDAGDVSAEVLLVLHAELREDERAAAAAAAAAAGIAAPAPPPAPA